MMPKKLQKAKKKINRKPKKRNKFPPNSKQEKTRKRRKRVITKISKKSLYDKITKEF